MDRSLRRGSLAVALIGAVRLGAGGAADIVESRASAQAGDPATRADVIFEIDLAAEGRPISPFLYGTNTPARLAERPGELTLARLSGNRFSTYNWETNASSAGKHSDHANDGDLVLDPHDNRPGAPVLAAAAEAAGHTAALLVTVPALGWVAADTTGVVASGTPIASRFFPSYARKPRALTAAPDLEDAAVYQDEFVHFITAAAPLLAGRGDLWFCIDNEPSLWDLNFPRVHAEDPTYAEVIARNIEYAAMIKDIAPNAPVLGGVLYGWDAFVSLQEAPDRFDPPYHGRLFLEVFLEALREAEIRTGRRLVDALDIHWYPEAQGGGVRVTSHDATEELVRARLQAPRSLWDPTYVEDSWITENIRRPIALLPWIREIIDRVYPGTKLVVSEHNFGGGAHISGGIAEADVLGIFGREGVHATALWELDEADHRYAYAGLAMYRNYDGRGGRFGDRSVPASTTDVEATSVYAALDSQMPGRATIVALNKTERWLAAELRFRGATQTRAASYRLTAARARPVPDGHRYLRDGVLLALLPPQSVSTLVLD